ncbi:GntR family transcriptional regulator [Halalkalibacter alkalisediminis]|uniref:GntR family transcriptional regulator n=1 Tax=Halalkalibacter alkalisediminis TaxID=935616 RepID=A0ABV6NIQ2_9BACI|nr:GntR family transcriptional regulator [Halalkalibacter alkalisediminis]
MKKVSKFVSYTDQVYRELKANILLGKISTGDFLQERSIAELLGVSRTPVREALKRLEFEGWLETIPWKGVIVKEIEKQDVIEVFQCRLANELFMIKLITPNLTDDQLNDLKSIFDNMEAALRGGKREEFIHEDRRFHMYLAQLTNNSRLVQFLDNLSDQMLRLGIRAITKESRANETLEEHEKLLSALQKRSVPEAVEAMEQHIYQTQETLMKMLDSVITREEN